MVLSGMDVFPKENHMFLRYDASRATCARETPERLSREGVPRVSRQPLEIHFGHPQAAVATPKKIKTIGT